MNLSDPRYIFLGLAMGLPIAALALLNWVFIKRGGFLKGSGEFDIYWHLLDRNDVSH